VDIKKIMVIAFDWACCSCCCLYWLSYFVQCYERKDMTVGDKILWTVLLLIPILGIILYRGLGLQWMKRQASVP